MGFGVLTVETIEIMAFWDVIQCTLGTNISEGPSTLKVESASSSETLKRTYQTTRLQIQEDRNLIADFVSLGQ
jgi:hypothetical protein